MHVNVLIALVCDIHAFLAILNLAGIYSSRVKSKQKCASVAIVQVVLVQKWHIYHFPLLVLNHLYFLEYYCILLY